MRNNMYFGADIRIMKYWRTNGVLLRTKVQECQ